MIHESSLLYWLWLSERCGAACREFPVLMRQCADPFELYRLSDEEIEHLSGIGSRLKERLCDKELEEAYRCLSLCGRQGIRVVPYTHRDYPERLRQLADPPVVLYVKGNLPDMNRRLCLGVVGTRRISEYGCRSTYTISYELAIAGAVIVSGMALGVDGVAAGGALAAGAPTVAVLGSGVSVIYPKQHKTLYRAILQGGGAVVSEYPPMAKAATYTFPQRNRIISGLSQGLLVIEGTRKSGSLITAECAMNQGRDLFALPGQIRDPYAEGPNLLIQKGAHPVLSSEDIFKHYEWMYQDLIHPLRAAPARGGDLPSMTEVLARYGVECIKEKPSDAADAFAKPKKPQGKENFKVEALPREAKPSGASSAVLSKKVADDRLASLEPSWLAVYEQIPLEGSISQEALSTIIDDHAALSLALMMLEMEGLCEALPGGQFRRK